ncbi:hypothetical protein A2627_05270 [Candidatus Woesebacteria bacterium RIFCSPHIGHO2_01_FULL_39_28]|uniref:OmpR/PhoB-type domain-containing protein n=1 Tax=Candidatus Woesebacteria bacterium RIFCSPHIGHO2_01_FULL_39_28 TaxID=1802496 RepID=A0A1F7Y8Z0_9BACT|nr:MAG: hypothetical protein A2627_05270 [Candidatus Woesebacteria bacterium RIFCSPHIGHO2_01_FULL_39_28]
MEEFREKILKFLSLGESVQIVAPPGFGKSRFGRSLSGLLLDTNLLQTPDDLMIAVKSSPQQKIIIIDSLDRILNENYKPFFSYLKGLRDAHKYQLAYVFLTDKLINTQYLNILNDLYQLISEHVEHIPTLKEKEYDTFAFSPTKLQLKEITNLTGGIPALVKICMLAMRDKIPLEPEKNIKLKAQLEEMVSISFSEPAYSNSKLVTDYLKNRQTRQLTASEQRMLDLLLNHKNEIVNKEDICKEVYPDVKNYEGISDHSIDQLVHRLREKVKDKYEILTIRGRGIRLTATPS